MRLGEARNPGPATHERDQTAEGCVAHQRRINEGRAQYQAARTLISGVRCATLWEGFCTARAHHPLRSWSPFFSAFFVALKSAVIDTVMGDVSVDIDRNLMNCYASLYVSSGEPTLVVDVFQTASRMRRIMATLLRFTARITRSITHVHTNINNLHTNRATHQKPITHQLQHGGGRRRRFACPCPGCQIDRLHTPQVPCCRYSTA